MTTIRRNGDLFSLATEVGSNQMSNAVYDRAGHMVQWGSSPSFVYSWDTLGRMTRITNTQHNPWSYAYTTDGERVAEIKGIFSGGFQPIEEMYSIRDLNGKLLRTFRRDSASGTWSWVKDYIWADGRLIASVDRDDGVRHFHLDHLGTPRAISDRCGDLVGEHHYFPFGKEALGWWWDSEPLKFTGQERDFSWTGNVDDLDYMHARYYNYNNARFLSIDPAGGDPGNPQSWNRYAYVLNDPVSLYDPLGMDEEPAPVKDYSGDLALQEEVRKTLEFVLKNNITVGLSINGALGDKGGASEVGCYVNPWELDVGGYTQRAKADEAIAIGLGPSAGLVPGGTEKLDGGFSQWSFSAGLGFSLFGDADRQKATGVSFSSPDFGYFSGVGEATHTSIREVPRMVVGFVAKTRGFVERLESALRDPSTYSPFAMAR